MIAAWLRGDAAGVARRLAETPPDVGGLVAATQRAVQARHQFALLDEARRAAHAAVVAQAVAAAVGADSDLVAVAAAIADEAAARAALVGPTTPAVTCGTYAPLLQLDVLGLDAASIVGPVLDVGCGPQALLVTALRARGLSARGVDRHVDPGVVGATAGDWADAVALAADAVTIVSHLALTLHFAHHAAAAGANPASGAEARRLAQVWSALVAGLPSGGVVACVPGAPLLERGLPATTFAVERRPLPADLDAALAPLGARLGHDVAYAAIIRRR